MKHSTALRAWAEHVAATAPPLTAEQRDVIISAFGGALRRQDAEHTHQSEGESSSD